MNRTALATVVAAAMLVASCGQTADTPTTPQDPALAAAGAGLYAAHCAECHGADMRGTDRGPSQLSEVYAPDHHGDGAYLLAVQRGVPAHHWRFGDMPRIDGLTADDVAAIVAYVRQQQLIEGFEPYPPGAEG
jgi:mono/diheme cytochrome c family protein